MDRGEYTEMDGRERGRERKREARRCCERVSGEGAGLSTCPNPGYRISPEPLRLVSEEKLQMRKPRTGKK
jgi:hypothetical protein